MRLGLITYNTRHLKTEQVALGLRRRSNLKLTFYALPFVARKPREVLFAHRPDMMAGAHTREIAAWLDAPYMPIESADDIPTQQVDLFLILGAGLLPPEFVRATAGRVINIHPGVIPLVRGLDAFKWAILEGMPVGNTLHFIDEQADSGEVVAISQTPLFQSDTLANFARRHYELEIAMMIDFQRYLDAPGGAAGEKERHARMRMPADLQRELLHVFEGYKAQFALSGADYQQMTPA